MHIKMWSSCSTGYFFWRTSKTERAEQWQYFSWRLWWGVW